MTSAFQGDMEPLLLEKTLHWDKQNKFRVKCGCGLRACSSMTSESLVWEGFHCRIQTRGLLGELSPHFTDD